jgi:hypothetical protein
MIVMCFFMTFSGNILLNIPMANVCLHFSIQEEDILGHSNAKCHLCTLYSTFRPLCNIGIYLITLLNIHVPRY